MPLPTRSPGVRPEYGLDPGLISAIPAGIQRTTASIVSLKAFARTRTHVRGSQITDIDVRRCHPRRVRRLAHLTEMCPGSLSHGVPAVSDILSSTSTCLTSSRRSRTKLNTIAEAIEEGSPTRIIIVAHMPEFGNDEEIQEIGITMQARALSSE